MKISILQEGKRIIQGSLDSINNNSVVKNLRIATALLPNWRMFRKLREQGFFYNRIDFNGTPCCIIYKGLDFEAQPRTSQSSGSKAIYLARRDNGEESYLLQYLPPNAKTSRHYHKRTTERFHNLEGGCEIEINGNPNPLTKSTLQVDPTEVHQVRTLESPSLTLIEMLGNPNGLTMEDHYYV